MRSSRVVSRATRLVQVLRDEFGATTPGVVTGEAVGDCIVDSMLNLASDPQIQSLSSGRIRVGAVREDGEIIDFDISVDVT